MKVIPENIFDFERKRFNLYKTITSRNNLIFTLIGWATILLGGVLEDWILTAIGWTMILLSLIHTISYLTEYHPQVNKNLKQLKYEIEIAMNE